MRNYGDGCIFIDDPLRLLGIVGGLFRFSVPVSAVGGETRANTPVLDASKIPPIFTLSLVVILTSLHRYY